MCTWLTTTNGPISEVDCKVKMFSKKKKKPQISGPSNFEHRVHTGFDKREGKYVGLPLQWASIVGNNQNFKSSNRPMPLVDPSEITPTELLDLKAIVRPNLLDQKLGNGGLALPKTSHVARSNSLRSSSPPRVRRDLRGNANVPPSVPEEPTQYPSMRRDGTMPHKMQPAVPPNLPPHARPHHMMPPPPHLMAPNEQHQQQLATNNGSMYQNGNPMQPLNIHTDIPAPYFAGSGISNNNNNRYILVLRTISNQAFRSHA